MSTPTKKPKPIPAPENPFQSLRRMLRERMCVVNVLEVVLPDVEAIVNRFNKRAKTRRIHIQTDSLEPHDEFCQLNILCACRNSAMGHEPSSDVAWFSDAMHQICHRTGLPFPQKCQDEKVGLVFKFELVLPRPKKFR